MIGKIVKALAQAMVDIITADAKVEVLSGS